MFSLLSLSTKVVQTHQVPQEDHISRLARQRSVSLRAASSSSNERLSYLEILYEQIQRLEKQAQDILLSKAQEKVFQRLQNYAKREHKWLMNEYENITLKKICHSYLRHSDEHAIHEYCYWLIEAQLRDFFYPNHLYIQIMQKRGLNSSTYAIKKVGQQGLELVPYELPSWSVVPLNPTPW